MLVKYFPEVPDTGKRRSNQEYYEILLVELRIEMGVFFPGICY